MSLPLSLSVASNCPVWQLADGNEALLDVVFGVRRDAAERAKLAACLGVFVALEAAVADRVRTFRVALPKYDGRVVAKLDALVLLVLAFGRRGRLRCGRAAFARLRRCRCALRAGVPLRAEAAVALLLLLLLRRLAVRGGSTGIQSRVWPDMAGCGWVWLGLAGFG